MKSSRSSLFLIELTISILFFSIASAVCIQLFVKSHLLDIQTQETNQTVIWSQNLAELWTNADGDLVTVYNTLRSDYGVTDGSIYMSNNLRSVTLYFNSDWEWSGSEPLAITYHIHLSDYGYNEETGLCSARISFCTNGDVFYTLPLQLHPATERGTDDE